jgi:hypothetical protein
MEEWKPIEGYEDYQISNLGRVKSLKNNNELIMKQSKTRLGYVRVWLYTNCCRKEKQLHRLIASTFIPNPDNKPEVDHINRQKDDNRIENLRWVSRSDNCINVIARNKLNQKNIYLTKDDTYNVQIYRNDKRVLDKTYKTFEEAVNARNDFLDNYLDETL